GRARALLLKTIIGLAHDLGMQAIAEGVESEAHVKELRALGCDMVQGYLYGQAMNAEDARRALDRRPRLVAAQ
ncbi:EAL domain-containing protein, partial [Mycobacterium tuberculosis]|nr:EAL domain-containing protein [Mycobacterium tuberculosis]